MFVCHATAENPSNALVEGSTQHSWHRRTILILDFSSLINQLHKTNIAVQITN